MDTTATICLFLMVLGSSVNGCDPPEGVYREPEFIELVETGKVEYLFTNRS